MREIKICNKGVTETLYKEYYYVLFIPSCRKNVRSNNFLKYFRV